MKKAILLSLTTLLIISLSSFVFEKEAAQKDWIYLGQRKVNYGLDKDVIHVGVQNSGFTKLKIKVTGGALNMHKMVVTYGNGEKDNISLKYNFHKGAESRVIDLRGGKRQIKKITFWYDSKKHHKQRASIHVAGKRR